MSLEEPNAVLGANTPGDDLTEDVKTFVGVGNEPKPGEIVKSNPFGPVASEPEDEPEIDPDHDHDANPVDLDVMDNSDDETDGYSI